MKTLDDVVVNLLLLAYVVSVWLLVGCAHTPDSPAVYGVGMDWQETKADWPGAADTIAACGAKLADPRAMNGLRVKVSRDFDALHRDCLNVHAAACYIAQKDLAVVGPWRADAALPGFCHEVGHRIALERSGGDDADDCHLQTALWAAIDGSTCTCRCPAAP